MNRHEKALEILHQGTVIPATPLALDENREFYEEGLSLPSSFWILLCKNVMFRPRATICGYDGKKNERKNALVLCKTNAV